MFKHEKTDQGLKLVDVLCNECGMSCGTLIRNAFGEQTGISFNFANVQVSWGTEDRLDFERHSAHWCRACYERLTEKQGLDYKYEPQPATEEELKEERKFWEKFKVAAERLRQNPEAWTEYKTSEKRFNALVFGQLLEEGSDEPAKPDSGDDAANQAGHS